MAYKCFDAHDGGDCDRLRLYINWHCRQINHNQLGLCINEYIIELISISSDPVSMDVDGGFDGGFDSGFNGWFNSEFDGGFNGWFHLAVLGLSTSAKHSTAQTRGFYSYQPRRFNGLVGKRTRCFTDYYNSDLTLL